MILEPATEPVEIKNKRTGEVLKFKLVEHTGEELDQYIIDSSDVYDTALEKLRDIGNDPLLTADALMQIKAHVAEHSAALLAKLLIPDGNHHSIDGEWIYKNTTRRQRGQLIDKQNELNGIETVQDQGFLIERMALVNSLAIKRDQKRAKVLTQQLQTGQEDLQLAEDLTEQLSQPDSVDPSIPASENSPESGMSYRIETIEPSGHVPIDELSPGEDGLVLL